MHDHVLIIDECSTGTSLALAHVAGVIALLKAAHAEWSPAAIHSAMMTTANPFDRHGGKLNRDDGKDNTPTPSPFNPPPNESDAAVRNETAAPLAMELDSSIPTKLLNPGLIYDANEEDVGIWVEQIVPHRLDVGMVLRI